MQVKAVSVGLVALAALVGGAAGAGATWALSSAPDDEPRKSKQKRAAEADAIDEEGEAVGERIARLERELSALRQRNQSTEALRKYAGVLDKRGDSGDEQDGSEDGASGDELEPVLDAEDPTFELAVRTVLDRVDWEREEERRVTQSKRREERVARQTELLAQRLKLNPSQVQHVERVLVEQMETFRKLRNDDDPNHPRPATRSEWRQAVEAIRAETEEKLGKVLDEGQMASYQQFVEEEGFGWRGGRGRGGGDRSQRSDGSARAR